VSIASGGASGSSPSGASSGASGGMSVGKSGGTSKILYNDQDHTATIGSIKMDIKSGDITKEHADAIVNSTNSDLSLTTGTKLKHFYLVANGS